MTETPDAAKIIDIRAQVEARIQEESPDLPPDDTGGPGGGPPITPKFIRQCLKNKERGDGILYATLHRGRFVCNLKERDPAKDRGIWLYYNGVHWEMDKRFLAHEAVEDVATLYQQESEKLADLLDTARANLLSANKQVALANKLLKKAEKTGDADKKADADDLGFAAEAEAEKYKQEYAIIKADKKEFDSRVDHLRSCNGREKTLIMAHRIGQRDSLAVIGNEFDQKPWLLPCKNGVIDLQTGRLLPGRPEDYLLRAVPFEYHYDPLYLLTGDNSPCPTWDKFIDEIHQDDPAVCEFVKRMIGYGITGLTSEHIFPIFTGAGRNGKGTMFETIKYILDELAWAIEPEMFLDQKFTRSSAGPSADKVSLYGRRFVIASETDDGRKISAAMVKKLTGGDTLTVRSPFDKYEWGFVPSHSIYLYTQDIPYGVTKDFALRQRTVIIDYPLRYVDDPNFEAEQDPANAHLFRLKDKALPAKLKAETPGILMALVRYCLLWQRDGFNPPDSIRQAVADRHREEDTLGQFFDECLEITRLPTDWEKFGALYAHYLKWWDEYLAGGKAKPVSKKAFAKYLKEDKGFECDHSNGRRYLGVRITDQYRFAE